MYLNTTRQEWCQKCSGLEKSCEALEICSYGKGVIYITLTGNIPIENIIYKISLKSIVLLFVWQKSKLLARYKLWYSKGFVPKQKEASGYILPNKVLENIDHNSTNLDNFPILKTKIGGNFVTIFVWENFFLAEYYLWYLTI